MGSVYLARDIKHGRQVAIKVVVDANLSREAREAFLREIRLTARLQHPHILPLLDSGEAAGRPYYVMPFARDGSLRDLLRRRHRLPLGTVLTLACSLADALSHAHENRVVHCDLKPENVLLSSGQAILSDFGISRALHKDAAGWRAALGQSMGTPVYASPESIAGEPVDGRADVFSLGCVVYEMLAGRPPFKADTALATLARRFAGQIPHDSAIPGSIAEVLERALAVDRHRRYPSVAQFVRALTRAAGETRGEFRDRVDEAMHRLRVLTRQARRYWSRRSGTAARGSAPRVRPVDAALSG